MRRFLYAYILFALVSCQDDGLPIPTRFTGTATAKLNGIEWSALADVTDVQDSTYILRTPDLMAKKVYLKDHTGGLLKMVRKFKMH